MDSAGTDSDKAVEGGEDPYEITSWEVRSTLDRVSVAIYTALVWISHAVVVLLAALIFIAIGGVSILTDPELGVLTVFSILPALALVAYVWHLDVTESESLLVMAVTFLLGVLTAGFAAVLNSGLQPVFDPLGLVGMILFFFVVVGPVEETVKLLAVWLYAYPDERFRAVVDGAVYGAVAGLGFATIENAIYITRAIEEVDQLVIGLELIGMGGDITATRALAGPGHVVYSAFAGYYLGLAKFNPENRGPIVVKGILIAAAIHATYNATVGFATNLIQSVTGLPTLVGFLLFVVLYVGFFGFLLYRKLQRYARAYRGGGGSGVASDGGSP